MKIAIIGTGTLGPQIAQVFAQSEWTEVVYLCKGRETSKDGKDKVVQAYQKLVAKEKISQELADKYLAKIVSGTRELAADADLLIEALSENLEIKKEMFKALDHLCKENCIFATNTSSLPIQEIGEGLSRPLIGMHFFNPAPVMKLVYISLNKPTLHG